MNYARWVSIVVVTHELLLDPVALAGMLDRSVPDDAIEPSIDRWAISAGDQDAKSLDTVVRVIGRATGIMSYGETTV